MFHPFSILPCFVVLFFVLSWAMASMLGTAIVQRRVLCSLDPNRDLNYPRRLSRRRPITLDKENEIAAIEGVRLGVYDEGEVLDLTDTPRSVFPAVRDQHVGFREEAHDRFHPDPSDLEEILRQRGDRFPSVSPDRMLSDEELQMTGEEVSEHLRSYAYEDEEEGEEDDDDDGDDDDMDGNGNDNDEEGLPDERDRVTYFDPSALGLKEINNLAHFGVSSHKPGNGVAELLSDDLDKYWQSDGQQPHLLTIHFLRRVEIRAIRFFVDYSQDESYTPTHIVFSAGTGHHDLTQFAEVHLSDPVGWQDVPIADCGGGRDGHSLCCWIVQMEIKENHQNGKDTHIRGIKIFALDEYAAAGGTEATVEDAAATADHRVRTAEDDYQDLLDTLGRMDRDRRYKPGDGGFSSMPDFMRDPELR